MLTTSKANAIYTILVTDAGAHEINRAEFLAHQVGEHVCDGYEFDTNISFVAYFTFVRITTDDEREAWFVVDKADVDSSAVDNALGRTNSHLRSLMSSLQVA